MSLTAKQRRNAAERWCCTPIAIWHWDHPDASETDHNRIQAATYPHGVETIPGDDFTAWIGTLGITKAELSRFYGYHTDSIRRFEVDPTCMFRLIDMVMYYHSLETE